MAAVVPTGGFAMVVDMSLNSLPPLTTAAAALGERTTDGQRVVDVGF